MERRNGGEESVAMKVLEQSTKYIEREMNTETKDFEKN